METKGRVSSVFRFLLLLILKKRCATSSRMLTQPILEEVPYLKIKTFRVYDYLLILDLGEGICNERHERKSI
jgi:hypothetical protein